METDSDVSNDSVESFGVTCSSNNGCDDAIDRCEDVRIDATDPKKTFYQLLYANADFQKKRTGRS
jgi:hypothetical protein